MAQDPLKYFRIEARELLDELTAGALKLEQGGTGDTLADLLRHAHTLKGAARIVRQLKISELSHAIEDLLVPHRERGGSVSGEIVSRMLALLDGIAAELRALEEPVPSASQAESEPAPAMETAESFGTVRIEVKELDLLLRAVSQAGARSSALRRVRAALESGEQAVAEGLGRLNGGSTAAPAFEQLRTALRAGQRELAAWTDEFERDMTSIEERLADLRLLPARTIFAALARAARDSARAEGKQIRFVAQGGHYRLDAGTLRAAGEALGHLVRNAAVHGIESAGERAAAGKPAEGRIEVAVERALDQVLFVCQDDGRGLDTEKIGRSAARRGLISNEAAQALRAQDAIDLLLQGGISTRPSVTEHAGRGIGLEAVQSVVKGLKGSLRVESPQAGGLRIEITAPASLESLDVLVLQLGRLKLAVPLDAVQETRAHQPDALAHGPNGPSVLVGGRLLPCIALAGLWPGLGPVAERSLIVLRAAERSAALIVGDPAGRERVLMQQLPAAAGPVATLLGAFIDADGRPVPVLAPGAVVAAAHVDRRGAADRRAVPRKPRVLVIDDSLTSRILEQSILENAGYEVDLAVSGEDGLEKARGGRYDVFLVDIEMPGIDGFQFIERVRGDPELRHIPSVLVTSRASSEDKLRGREAGAQAYIAKGEFDEREFLRTINGLVGLAPGKD